MVRFTDLTDALFWHKGHNQFFDCTFSQLDLQPDKSGTSALLTIILPLDPILVDLPPNSQTVPPQPLPPPSSAPPTRVMAEQDLKRELKPLTERIDAIDKRCDTLAAGHVNLESSIKIKTESLLRDEVNVLRSEMKKNLEADNEGLRTRVSKLSERVRRIESAHSGLSVNFSVSGLKSLPDVKKMTGPQLTVYGMVW